MLQILLHEVRSREILHVLALLNCRMGISSPRVDRGRRGGHMVVFQVKVLQVTLVRQLVDHGSECFTFCLFAQNRGLLFLFQWSSWILPFWWSLFLLSLCGLRRSRRSRRNQRCKVFVINGLITSFFERFLSCCRTYKGSVILIFTHVWCVSRVCWFSL